MAEDELTEPWLYMVRVSNQHHPGPWYQDLGSLVAIEGELADGTAVMVLCDHGTAPAILEAIAQADEPIELAAEAWQLLPGHWWG